MGTTVFDGMETPELKSYVEFLRRFKLDPGASVTAKD